MRMWAITFFFLASCGGEPPTSIDAALADADATQERDQSLPDVTVFDAPPTECVPRTCASLGQTCEDGDDGCGGMLDCGPKRSPAPSPIEWGGMQYVNWGFEATPQRYVEHQVCFDRVQRGSQGLFIQVYDGSIDGSSFYFGFQDLVSDTPGDSYRGVVFSNFGTTNIEDTQVSGDAEAVAFAEHEGGFVGVRLPYAWDSGCYTTRIEITDAGSVEGDWVQLSIEHEGLTQVVGSIRFQRADINTRVTFPNNGGSWTEYYGSRVNTRSSDIGTYYLRISAKADDGDALTASAAYHRLGIPNASVELLATTGEISFRFGGNTSRCTPGIEVGDWIRQEWTF